MRRRILLLLGLMALILSFSSCSGTKDVTSVSGLSPFIDINNYTKLGEVTVTVESRTYLGFIKIIDLVNGEKYNPREKKVINGLGSGSLNKAMYVVTEQFPDADCFTAVSPKKHIEKLFLGRYTKESVVVKAYKLND